MLNTTWLVNSVLELEESDSGFPDLNLLYYLRLNFPEPKVTGSVSRFNLFIEIKVALPSRVVEKDL